MLRKTLIERKKGKTMLYRLLLVFILFNTSNVYALENSQKKSANYSSYWQHSIIGSLCTDLLHICQAHSTDDTSLVRHSFLVNAIFGIPSIAKKTLDHVKNYQQSNDEGFVAGTPVSTPKGLVLIEHIKKNDTIFCHSLKDGTITYCTVGQVKKSSTQQTTKLTLEDGTVMEAASKHKIYSTLAVGWRCIEALHYFLSDQAHKQCHPSTLVNKNTPNALIQTPYQKFIHGEKSHQEKVVYNLYVRKHHNYLVTKHRIPAHNFIPALAAAWTWFVAHFEVALTVYIGPFLWKVYTDKQLRRQAGQFIVHEIVNTLANKLTNKEARQRASDWGWQEDKNPPKSVIRHTKKHNNPPVFKDPARNRWISPDQDNHGGGVWKEFDRGGRVGTLDENLTPIRD
jgi:hypothetical protein